MKLQWAILLISAFTDFIINAGTAVGAAMVATGNAAQMPSTPVILLALIGGTVAAARTVQAALKVTPEITKKLKGE